MNTLQSMSGNPDIIGRVKPRDHRRKPFCARKLKIFVEQSGIQKGRDKCLNGAEKSGEMEGSKYSFLDRLEIQLSWAEQSSGNCDCQKAHIGNGSRSILNV
jgi:hypothetical protein